MGTLDDFNYQKGLPQKRSGTLDAYLYGAQTAASQASKLAAANPKSSTLTNYAYQTGVNLSQAKNAVANQAKAVVAKPVVKPVIKPAEKPVIKPATTPAPKPTTSSTSTANTSTVSTSSNTVTAQPEEPIYQSVSDTSTTATAASVTSSDVKIATSNLFIFEDIALTAETMTDLVFEDIGGRELIDIVSGDMVYDLSTQAAPNQPIKNLSSVVERYSPRNLINLQGTSDKFFQSNFQIDINSYIPPSSDVISSPHVYIVTPETSNDSINDQLLDHLVIEIVNINVANNERVEVQILSYDELYNDTIYGG